MSRARLRYSHENARSRSLAEIQSKSRWPILSLDSKVPGRQAGRQPSTDVLHFICHGIILSLQFMDETVETIVNSRLVLFIHRYQNFEAVLGIVSLACWECSRAVSIVTSMAPAPIFVQTAISTVGSRFKQRRKEIVRFWDFSNYCRIYPFSNVKIPSSSSFEAETRPSSLTCDPQ